jgi:hypothetical protein
MRQFPFFALLAVGLSGCYQTENGLVFGKPSYEETNIEVSQVDLKILRKADALLKDEAVWRKDAVRVCTESATLNLYCALERASIEVTGTYEHRRPALQEVRFVIDDKYKHRWSVHRLADFNAHPDTTFKDIKLVIAVAIENVSRKLRITTGSTRPAAPAHEPER